MKQSIRLAIAALLDLAGAGLVVGGVALVYIPAALVVAGLAVLAISWKATT